MISLFTERGEFDIVGGETLRIEELQGRFTEAAESFSFSVQTYLSVCHCDEDTKAALDEIARQAFHAIVGTQNALIEYLEEK